MNPFTRFLKQWTRNEPNLTQFIEHWDQLEALAIRVYKAGSATPADHETYTKIKMFMDEVYQTLEESLKPYWVETEVGGSVDHADPFRFLFTYSNADGFIDNWAALQHLPAAREALNGWLVAHGKE